MAMDNSEQVLALLKQNPQLASMLQTLLTNPQVVSSKEDPNKMLDKLHVSLSVCAICGKEQKVFTVQKPQVTQMICTGCQNSLNCMDKPAQAQVVAEALRKDHFGMAKARFEAMIKHFKKVQKQQDQQQKASGFNVLGIGGSNDSKETE